MTSTKQAKTKVHPKCLADGCNREGDTRGLCRSDYTTLRRHVKAAAESLNPDDPKAAEARIWDELESEGRVLPRYQGLRTSPVMAWAGDALDGIISKLQDEEQGS